MDDLITRLYMHVFPFSDRALPGLAVLMGVSAGITVWRMAWHSYIPGLTRSWYWSHVARAVLLTGVAVVAWPAVIILVALCQFDGPRTLIERFVFGKRPTTEDPGQA
ncbi:hypothetical protein [Amycolatopsis rubida]|uniref:Uncharacterized protein n=1 Tax=Amycolatopsis rubida TaxID=112413 RepID=A0A1I5E478_9PSEU|nr:hypothetical protein [Amycolatopsis rubida]SFO06207.1 hypothetical protein SAMN05421854_101485 [Amycolatopsis rubida]